MMNYYTHDDDKKQKFIIVAIVIAVIIIIAIIINIVMTTKQKVIDVKVVSWTYTINIQELKAIHEEGWSTPPSDAYDIKSYRKKKKSETRINSKGQAEKFEIYDTWYEYTVNKWITSRYVTTHDIDKNPYWGEPNIYSSGYDQLGDERESGRDELYEVSGVDILSTDTTLITIPISKALWTDIKVGDQLNCEFVLGKAQNIQLAQ